MSKSLKRLLALRERLKKVAEVNLHASFNARAREESCIADNQAASHLGSQNAGALLQMQERKEAAFARMQRLDQVVAEQQLALNHAKQAHRQIEKLVENHTERRADQLLQNELREQEDWVRAKAHRKNEP